MFSCIKKGNYKDEFKCKQCWHVCLLLSMQNMSILFFSIDQVVKSLVDTSFFVTWWFGWVSSLNGLTVYLSHGRQTVWDNSVTVEEFMFYSLERPKCFMELTGISCVPSYHSFYYSIYWIFTIIILSQNSFDCIIRPIRECYYSIWFLN